MKYLATINNKNIEANTLTELHDQADRVNVDDRKADWTKIDQEGATIGEGGICLDDECRCAGQWTHWEV